MSAWLPLMPAGWNVQLGRHGALLWHTQHGALIIPLYGETPLMDRLRECIAALPGHRRS